MGTMTNQLEFHLTTWKGDKMKCQQQRQSSRRNDEIRTHICSTEWAILLKLRYVSCKVWAKVVCCKLKLLHCQDSLSAARQISVALLTKRSKSTSRLLRRWDDIGLGFSALGRDTWHPNSTLHWLKATTSVSVSDVTVSERWSVRPRLKGGESWKENILLSVHHDFACPAYRHLCGSSAD